MSDCLFCQIVAGSIPAEILGESDTALAFRDIAPQAPVHFLVVPKIHVTSADHLADGEASVVDGLILLAQEVAQGEGVRESGYRLVMNVGKDAQMTVPHLHLHVLGGRLLEWPPG
jgi:histidine triad (HIT) family protein